ncbi:succinylglutamate desuccinylase/aspartoacylase family protein [Paraurantiacibacter namhicola]|uniref:Succinylglutamate desuccinylase n=1 Tax=Paraurantiacibacter namhicola TaxID=645517 RepID=A0A1C7D8G0_9SPHN|nr:succinylglutamate desuccinylase/aspartoacylase family protein [Paraurantiacibacter namhicola]ANU07776.1 succinylglutamate desuccinylase [Paraurantiacibacter namhicola]
MARAKPEGRAPFEFGGESVPAGQSATIDLPISRLSTRTEINMPVRVLHGTKPGPTLFVSAAIHGNEIVGVEMIRRLLKNVSAKRLAGTLLCVPVVNAFGFTSHSRYLPDGRDLNRVFPGSARGSLAAQLAHVFTEEIIKRCDYGIDLHSAGLNRENLPQIRYSPDNEAASVLAEAFGAPAIITSPLRPGSLRQTADDNGCTMILMESGEALRFDEFAIRVGVRGILRVMAHLEMGVRKQSAVAATPVRSDGSRWVRAEEGGIFRAIRKTGDMVLENTQIGYISDPFGDEDIPVIAPLTGLIIGRSVMPVVNQGDALMHIARVMRPGTADARLTAIEEAAFDDPLFDEDEVL